MKSFAEIAHESSGWKPLGVMEVADRQKERGHKIELTNKILTSEELREKIIREANVEDVRFVPLDGYYPLDIVKIYVHYTTQQL